MRVMRRRVLLAMQRLPRDIFKRVLTDAKGVELVGELTDGDDIAAKVCETRANFIIAGPGEDGTAISSFFTDYAKLEVLSVEEDGDAAVVHRLAPSQSPIGELTPEKLADVVCGENGA
jgi:hypothetical protein